MEKSMAYVHIHPEHTIQNLTREQAHPSGLSREKALSKEQYRMTKENAITIVECSNACPFVSHYDQYRCFYCQETFSEFIELRDHTEREHSVPILKPRMDTFTKGKFLMIDITDLRCRICNWSTPDVAKLKEHLNFEHGKLLFQGVDDGVIPFKLTEDSFDCLVCGKTFQKFQSLNTHMNSHYGDKVCDVCGAGFLSKGRLKSHKILHNTGTFPCEQCDKVFVTLAKKRKHVNYKHNKLPRYKCPKCPEDFKDYYMRITHMWNVHDIHPPQHTCDICGQVFRRPYLIALHKKKFHTMEVPQVTVTVTVGIPGKAGQS